MKALREAHRRLSSVGTLYKRTKETVREQGKEINFCSTCNYCIIEFITGTRQERPFAVAIEKGNRMSELFTKALLLVRIYPNDIRILCYRHRRCMMSIG